MRRKSVQKKIDIIFFHCVNLTAKKTNKRTNEWINKQIKELEAKDLCENDKTSKDAHQKGQHHSQTTSWLWEGESDTCSEMIIGWVMTNNSKQRKQNKKTLKWFWEWHAPPIQFLFLAQFSFLQKDWGGLQMSFFKSKHSMYGIVLSIKDHLPHDLTYLFIYTGENKWLINISYNHIYTLVYVNYISSCPSLTHILFNTFTSTHLAHSIY